MRRTELPVPVAQQIVLQLAFRDIGQVTDLSARPTYSDFLTFTLTERGEPVAESG
jgi:hypothetical protein